MPHGGHEARPTSSEHSSSQDNGNDWSSRRSVAVQFETASINTSTSKRTKKDKWRRTLGLILLFTTVILWTASNFLASTLFADDTYSKPYFVTYINTTFFIIPLIPMLARQLYHDPASVMTYLRSWRYRSTASYSTLSGSEDMDSEATSALKHDDNDDSPYAAGNATSSHDRHHHEPLNPPHPALLPEPSHDSTSAPSLRSLLSLHAPGRLSLSETARLSLEFCILWFMANYLVAACLEYTTVASSTILTSTSSVFTLLFGTLFKVETFTLRKLAGVGASLAGIILISTVDLSGSSDENRGDFPHKSIRELGVGDGMALLSAVLYGLYAVFMKKRIGDEGRVHMPLFFGLVGLFNVLLLWPGFVLLHYTGIEPWLVPPDGKVGLIIAVNSVSSLVSDFAWAYAVLLTSPIVVTVGLSTTIPLSLIGQMVLNHQTASVLYWVGALIVVASFLIVNHDDNGGDDEVGDAEGQGAAAQPLGQADGIGSLANTEGGGGSSVRSRERAAAGNEGLGLMAGEDAQTPR